MSAMMAARVVLAAARRASGLEAQVVEVAALGESAVLSRANGESPYDYEDCVELTAGVVGLPDAYTQGTT